MLIDTGYVYLFRVRLGDGRTWVVISDKEVYADALAEAEAKRETHFPWDTWAKVEAWTRGTGLWFPVSRAQDCARCPDKDVMPSLGCACYVSCGGTE